MAIKSVGDFENATNHEKRSIIEDGIALNTFHYWFIRGGMILVSLVALGMWGCPTYNVWQKGLAGEAELSRAEQNRRILVEEAQAKLDSAELLNQAEVARARGLAEATGLVVDSFGGPDAYLRYLWIQSLENNKANIIYVPTEAGLPILEAGRQP